MIADALPERAVARYHALCEDPALGGPSVVEWFVREMHARKLVYRDVPQCRSLRPRFITRAQLARLRELSATLTLAFAAVERAALRESALMDALGLSASERALCALDPHGVPSVAVSRIDTFFAGDPAVMEYNADSPAGISYESGQAALMRELPVMRAFEGEFALEHLDGAQRLRAALLDVWEAFVAERVRRGGNRPGHPPTIALVDLADAATSTEFALVVEDLRAHGFEAFVTSPEALRYTDAALRAGERRIDLVYKRLLVADVLARYTLDHPLVRAYADGAVAVASGFRCCILHKKKLLAVLHDPAYARLFSNAARAAIARFVPQTLSLDRLDESGRAAIVRERAAYVIKPNDDFGGHGVTIGAAVDDRTWEAAVACGVAQGMVAQRHVTPAYESFPVFDPAAPQLGARCEDMIVDTNPVLYLGQAGSLLSRMSRDPVVNVARGGGAVPTFVLEGR